MTSSAQYAENIRSGRPGVTIGPYTTGKGVLQNQNGFYNINSKTSGLISQERSGNYFIAVFRMGITETFELGGGIAYADYRLDLRDSESGEELEYRQEGVSIATIAMRSNVYEGDGLIPAFGYQVNLDLNTVSDEFRSKYVSPRITLMTRQAFEHFRFITNFVGRWSGDDGKATGLYSLFLDRGFGKRIRIYVEHYGIVNSGDIRPKFDAGILYLVNKDIQLDFQYGVGPEHQK